MKKHNDVMRYIFLPITVFLLWGSTVLSQSTPQVTLSVSQNPTYVGQSITVTVHVLVDGAPATGLVGLSLYEIGSDFGGIYSLSLSSGQVTYTFGPFSSPNQYEIRAWYPPPSPYRAPDAMTVLSVLEAQAIPVLGIFSIIAFLICLAFAGIYVVLHRVA